MSARRSATSRTGARNNVGNTSAPRPANNGTTTTITTPSAAKDVRTVVATAWSSDRLACLATSLVVAVQTPRSASDAQPFTAENVSTRAYRPNAAAPSPCRSSGSETIDTAIAQTFPAPDASVLCTVRRWNGRWTPIKRSGGPAEDGGVLAPDSMTSGESARSGDRLMASGRVAVLLPTLDEQSGIRDCLDSLAAQDYAGPIEVIVVDGGSRDRTRSIAAEAGVRVVDNPGVTAAAAMNVGTRATDADIIVRADAHTLYESDYIRRCVDGLTGPRSDGVAVIGGPMRPIGITRFGRAVAAVTSSPWGVGPGRFHFASERSEVDTVYLGAFRPDTLRAVGGYDEQDLQWGAEDHELNLRIRSYGGRVVVDPAIRSWYFPRQSAPALARQYFNYGRGKASTLRKHRRLPHWRPLVPAALVLATATAAGVAAWRREPLALVTLPAAYLTGTAAVALRLARLPGVTPGRAATALVVCHWAYGLGFWAGVARILSGRGFDARPGRSRV